VEIHANSSSALDFSNWIFTNDTKNGYYEFAKEKGLLDLDKWHPLPEMHPIFVDEFLLPRLKNIL
jgi:hypothetical protein